MNDNIVIDDEVAQVDIVRADDEIARAGELEGPFDVEQEEHIAEQEEPIDINANSQEAFDLFNSDNQVKLVFSVLYYTTSLLNFMVCFYKRPSATTFNTVLANDSELFTTKREEDIEDLYVAYEGETEQMRTNRIEKQKEAMQRPFYKKYVGVKMCDPLILLWAHAAVRKFPQLIGRCKYPLYLDRAYRFHEKWLSRELQMKDSAELTLEVAQWLNGYLRESVMIFYADGDFETLFRRLNLFIDVFNRALKAKNDESFRIEHLADGCIKYAKQTIVQLEDIIP